MGSVDSYFVCMSGSTCFRFVVEKYVHIGDGMVLYYGMYFHPVC